MHIYTQNPKKFGLLLFLPRRLPFDEYIIAKKGKKMKIAYAKQSGNMVSLYDPNNREYVRISGELVSSTSEFVLTRGAGINDKKHIYDACGRWVRDV